MNKSIIENGSNLVTVNEGGNTMATAMKSKKEEIIYQEDNYKIIQGKYGFSLKKKNLRNRWENASGITFSNMPIDVVVSGMAKGILGMSLAGIRVSSDIDIEKVKVKSAEIMGKIEPKYKPSKEEKVREDEINRQKTLEYILDTNAEVNKLHIAVATHPTNVNGVSGAIKLSKNKIGAVIYVKWSGDSASFSELMKSSNMMDIVKSYDFNITSAQKTQKGEFLFSSIKDYKDENDIDPNYVKDRWKAIGELIPKIAKIMDEKPIATKTTSPFSHLLSLEWAQNHFSNYEVAQQNNYTFIISKGSAFNISAKVYDDKGDADITISMQYLEDVDNLTKSKLSVIPKVIDAYKLTFNEDMNIFTGNIIAYQFNQMTSDSSAENAMRRLKSDLDAINTLIAKCIKDDNKIINQNEVNTFKGECDSIMGIEGKEVGKDGVQYDNIPTGVTDTTMKAKFTSKRVMCTIQVSNDSAEKQLKSNSEAFSKIGFNLNGTKLTISQSISVTYEIVKLYKAKFERALTLISKCLDQSKIKAKEITDKEFKSSIEVIEGNYWILTLKVDSVTNSDSGKDGKVIRDYIVKDKQDKVVASSNMLLNVSYDKVIAKRHDIQQLLDMDTPFYGVIGKFIERGLDNLLTNAVKDANQYIKAQEKKAQKKTKNEEANKLNDTITRLCNEKNAGAIFNSDHELCIVFPLNNLGRDALNKNRDTVLDTAKTYKTLAPSNPIKAQFDTLFQLATFKGNAENNLDRQIEVVKKGIAFLKNKQVKEEAIKKFVFEDKLVINMTLGVDEISAEIKLTDTNKEIAWDARGKDYPANTIYAKGKTRKEIVDNYKEQFTRHNLSGHMALGEITDGRPKEYKIIPYQHEPDIMQKVKGWLSPQQRQQEKLKAGMDNEKALLDMYNNKEKIVQTPKEATEIPKAETIPKFAMVSDDSMREQLFHLQDVAKKLHNIVDADPEINLFFLEEPKEFKKYKLPTVALGLVCYNMDYTKQDLKSNKVFKKFKTAKGTVGLGNWFTTTDPDGKPCKMALFLDKSWEKASDENRRKVDKLYRTIRLMESIGESIIVNGHKMLLESTNDKFTILSVGDLEFTIPTECIHINETTQVDDVAVDIKDDLLKKTKKRLKLKKK